MQIDYEKTNQLQTQNAALQQPNGYSWCSFIQYSLIHSYRPKSLDVWRFNKNLSHQINWKQLDKLIWKRRQTHFLPQLRSADVFWIIYECGLLLIVTACSVFSSFDGGSLRRTQQQQRLSEQQKKKKCDSGLQQKTIDRPTAAASSHLTWQEERRMDQTFPPNCCLQSWRGAGGSPRVEGRRWMPGGKGEGRERGG